MFINIKKLTVKNVNLIIEITIPIWALILEYT